MNPILRSTEPSSGPPLCLNSEIAALLSELGVLPHSHLEIVFAILKFRARAADLDDTRYGDSIAVLSIAVLRQSPEDQLAHGNRALDKATKDLATDRIRWRLVRPSRSRLCCGCVQRLGGHDPGRP